MCAVAAVVTASTAPRIALPTSTPRALIPQEKPFGHLPLVVEPNRGQMNSHVRWLARGPGYTLFLTDTGAVMRLPQAGKPADVVRMRLRGSQPWQTGKGMEPTGGISNYILGNDPAKWRTRVPHYRGVRVPGVYPGIDLIFYGNPQMPEYDFVVQPGADPKQIHVAYEGVERMNLGPGGDFPGCGLELEVAHGDVQTDLLGAAGGER